jgi:outer membrane lipoprotein LolB
VSLRRVAARTLLLAGSGALAACAGLPSAPSLPQLSGRLSLQVAAHDGQPARGVNAAFDLVGDARAGELRLSAPLGPQLASARWSPGEATLRTADGETRHADLASLAGQALGEPLPLQALPDWLQGRAWPGAPSVPVAGGFEQLGWALDLARWDEGFVVARRVAPPPVTLRVRGEPR